MIDPERDYTTIAGVIAVAMLSTLVFRCWKRDRDAARRLLIPDVLVGLVILLVGVLFSWFFSLLIFGFGQLVENSEVSTSIAVHNYNRQQKNAEADDPEADKDSRQQQVFQKYMYWTCPECGTVNMSTDNYCTECGLKNKT